MFSTRGISHRDRHLMEDIKKLMPHHKPEAKMERSKTLTVVNEVCEMKNCNKAVMFEGRKKMDLYMWLSNVPNGPSVKCLVENSEIFFHIKTMIICVIFFSLHNERVKIDWELFEGFKTFVKF